MTEISSAPPPTSPRIDLARAAAERLEAGFLAEMLKSAGFGDQVSAFSGGAGEDQFASFHREAVAEQMVRAGGLGLSEFFFKAILEADHAKPDTD